MQRLIKFGALAVMSVIVLLCALVLMLLVYSTAMTDKKSTDRYAKTVKQQYHLEAQGQEWLATSPKNTGAVIGNAGGRHLEVAVDKAGNITRWQLVPRQNTPNPGMKNLLNLKTNRQK